MTAPVECRLGRTLGAGIRVVRAAPGTGPLGARSLHGRLAAEAIDAVRATLGAVGSRTQDRRGLAAGRLVDGDLRWTEPSAKDRAWHMPSPRAVGSRWCPTGLKVGVLPVLGALVPPPLLPPVGGPQLKAACALPAAQL